MAIDNNITAYIPGRCYFKVTYFDVNFVYPKLETVVYLGNSAELKDRLQTEESFLYFQDAESYANHGFLNSHGHELDEDEMIISETTETIAKKTIFDIDGMVQELMR